MLIYAAAGISFIAVALLSPVLITLLRRLKLTQPIRKELPSNHQAKKGTPLMLGLIFLVGAFSAPVFMPGRLTYFLSLIFILFGLVGFMDDYRKASRQDPRGISGKAKLFFQFLFTVFLLSYSISKLGLDAGIVLFRSYSLEMPMLVYIAVMTLFVVGSANAINFTDGLDGLLGVAAVPTYFFFYAVSERQEVKAFCLIMIACILGFLLYNLFPAKAFMGDTGSLAIGGSLSMLAVIEKVEILIPVLFLVYFAEQLSVVLQVLSFKLTGRRIFKMAPIHYHFGLKYGWSENRIVAAFGVLSWACALICWLYREFLMTM